MSRTRKKDLLLGTLDLLILRVLNGGENYGYKIAKRIQLLSSEVLSVQKGSLYPALHRLETEGFIKSEWKVTDREKPMKTYALTSGGKKRMEEELENWGMLSSAVNQVIERT